MTNIISELERVAPTYGYLGNGKWADGGRWEGRENNTSSSLIEGYRKFPLLGNYRYIVELLLKYLSLVEYSSPSEDNLKQLVRDKFIVDVGCGIGSAVYYARNLGINIEGIDNSERIVNIAHSLDRDYVKLADASNMPYRDRSVDI
ncbi:MAG: class I SAM-dependent methyltransferase, partial [Candidatus Omnitrophica bacterium]|nr:class I SAM-dependent methyltransferase [Candidatus Omnitrophota bacterium]